ncbi:MULTISPECIES: AIPR family protein [unclassified Bradyrhizobium]|uniref:AIPR family protein n=1 Tax=unclassified Bradyrhizobium TaxID=2631580 RepID=UPI0029169025|nr:MULTISPECIES: AIPR family protein [unclassified Bradyrhizobium]
MAEELEEFHKDFFQGVHGLADADGRWAEHAFFELFTSQLVEAGELETADRAPYTSPRGVRVDGYGGDPASAEGVLSLIILDFNQSDRIGTLTASEMDAIFKRLTNFLTRSLDATHRNSFEESTAAFGLADLIAKRWPNISKVRMFLLSNRVLSNRVDGREAGEFRGVPLTYSVWDLGRLYRFVETGRGREEILIDLETDFGGPLSALPAHLNDAGYEAYLIVIPGKQLAAIYDRWGARLLERNVRVFLQARGNVNKGIRNTIENDPEMFFAYNNGITATAEKLTTKMSDGGLLITELQNLQIVNGGQTTASIHAASRKKDVDLSRVFVQMKLSVVESAKAIEVVPKISEFANSQNRVNAADFFANHPYHVQLEKFSRTTFAPSPDGTFRESKWFYERARGQFQDARALLNPSQRKKFDLEYPKSQVFSKTDLAKFLNLWLGHPDIVSRGAQKNFAHFAAGIGKAWSKNPDHFNKRYYTEAVAKAIVFRETEKLVTEQSWYEGGYRANVVAYAIAKIAHDVEERERVVNFEGIWRKQGISAAFKDALTIAAKACHDVLVTPPPGMSNVTEWAKQQACWSRISALEITWPKTFLRELITREEEQENQSDAEKDQRLLNGIEAQTVVVQAGGPLWRTVREWGVSRRLLTPTEAGILDVAASIPNRLPSEKQSLIAIETLKKMHSEGCQIGVELLNGKGIAT